MSSHPYPPNSERKEIVFVRHAESQANLDGVWNGRTDGSLSDEGAASLEPLGARLSKWRFDAVLSSPLDRTRQTAAAFSDEVEVVDDFIEIGLGEWEGMLYADVEDKYGEELRASFRNRDLPMGGTGESLNQVKKRALAAVDGVFSRMSDGDRVAIVTHGGFMQAVLGRHMAGHKGRAHTFTSNTGITRIVSQFGRPRLASFNDTGHLGPRSAIVRKHVEAGDPVVALIRHGQTLANVERRWQGHGDWDLDDLGKRQVELLGEWYGRHNTVYSSPLKRAASTARHVASNGVVAVDDLKEIDMGEWEGLTMDEILEKWSDDVETIYEKGVDLPRGGTGESWAQLTERFSSAVGGLELAHGDLTLVVAHGGAIRSYISSLTKNDDSHAESLFTPKNASISHVALGEHGPEILDFSVATHLESLE